MEVYCVFYKLASFYDDNDKTLFKIVSSEDKAIELVNKYPEQDLVYERWIVK